MVREIVVDLSSGFSSRDSFSAKEEDELVGVIPGQICLGGRRTRHPVPIQFAVGFLEALAVAVVEVGHSGGLRELVFGVVGVSRRGAGRRGLREEIAGGVVAIAGDLVGGSSRNV